MITTQQRFRERVARFGLTAEGIAGQICLNKPGLPRDEAMKLAAGLLNGGPARVIVAVAIIDLTIDTRFGRPAN